MNIEIITVLTPFLTLIGSMFGAIVSAIINAKMTNFRLKQLEKEVEKHNNFAERMPVLEEKLKETNHRIENLERNAEHEYF